jgi:hypothetical protein|tara:strand:+ start:335 stop:739 length:405 start_codon:yes stop_codon:yes gene_type:complete
MAKKKVAKKTPGRKKIDFNEVKHTDWAKLDAILQFTPSAEIAANILDVSIDTLERRIKEEKNCTFSQYAKQKMAPVKIRLIKKAIDKAMNGDNTMLIFCLKNLCGWSDRPMDIISAENSVTSLTLNIPSNNREN